MHDDYIYRNICVESFFTIGIFTNDVMQSQEKISAYFLIIVIKWLFLRD